MNMVNAADSAGRRKARSCSAHELRDVLRAQRRRGAVGKRKEMVVGRPKNADLSWRAERAANNRQRCGDVRASGEPLGRAACTVSWTQTPTVVRRLVVRCGRSTRIDDRRRGMPGMPMHRRACVATGHRRRNTIVLGTRVDDPVPQEHRDQPQLDHGCQRSEPTRASHWYESMSCPARRHCPRYTAAIRVLTSVWPEDTWRLTPTQHLTIGHPTCLTPMAPTPAATRPTVIAAVAFRIAVAAGRADD